MTQSENLLPEYLALRDSITCAQIATLSQQGLPEASHAPLVWLDSHCFFLFSDLASHTQHLRSNPAIGLILVEPENGESNPFARQRISLQGEVELIERGQPLFASVLQQFHQQFGEIIQMIEPLQDFHLFRVNAVSGRYIRGFGQAFEIAGEHLDQLTHIDPRR